MDQSFDKKRKYIIYLIVNLPNFKRTAKRYLDKYNNLNEYTGVKSARSDVLITAGEKKSNVDIILEKDEAYTEYLKYDNKVKEVYAMLNVLNDLEREIILDWYTTPRLYRKKGEDFASEKGLSRAYFFKIKNDCLKRLVDFL